jgi:polyphenol oxidase
LLTIDGLARQPGLTHAFSTDRLGSMRVASARHAFAVELGMDPERMTAVGAAHGTAVARVDEPMGVVDGVDGLITDRPGVPLFATFADCRPLIIHDPVLGAVALCHAGWRGTAGNMAAAGVRALREAYGSRPEDLVAGIGPGICGACYEVGPEVARRFPAECAAPGDGDRSMLDLEAVNRLQLVEAGVPEARIFAHPACTLESPELPSHRRRPDGTRFAALAQLT